MEKSHFLGDWWFFMWFLAILLVGTGEPRHIATKTPLEKLNQNLGLADPPPSVGTKDKIFPMSLFEGSPKRSQPSLLRKIENNFWSKDCQDYWTDGNGLYKREGIWKHLNEQLYQEVFRMKWSKNCRLNSVHSYVVSVLHQDEGGIWETQ